MTSLMSQLIIDRSGRGAPATLQRACLQARVPAFEPWLAGYSEHWCTKTIGLWNSTHTRPQLLMLRGTPTWFSQSHRVQQAKSQLETSLVLTD
jgi:hypothetical protein